MTQKSTPNIRGLGTDIIEIERIRNAFQEHGERFLERLFTQDERAYCARYNDPFPHFAGRFAAKEAIVKALGTGMRLEVTWQEIEIINDTQGKPEVFLSPRLRNQFPNIQLLLSISHCQAYATAIAILTEEI